MMECRDHLVAYFAAKPETRYISGHFRCTDQVLELIAQGWSAVSVLRDPVAKWLSQYFYNRDKASDHFRIKVDIETFLESSRGKSYGQDYVQTFAPGVDFDIASMPESIEMAIARMRQLTCVGIIEDLPRFGREIEARIGVRPTIAHLNTNPTDQAVREREVTPAVRERIVELCAPNQAIYDAASAVVGGG